MKILIKVLGVILVAFLLLGGYYFYTDYVLPDNALNLSKEAGLFEVKYNITFKEKNKVCYENNLSCPFRDIEPLEDLSGLSLDEIKAKCVANGWVLEVDGANVTIINLPDGLCDEHKKFYHLGVNASGDYIMLYYGPASVGSNGGLYMATDYCLLNLDESEQKKIIEGYYESKDLDELQGVLDSFSE